MSHVSTTAHYNLPIYGGTDIINPLTDVNGTNEAVDTAIYEVSQALASGVTDITDVKNKVGDASLDTASQNLSGAVNELKSAIDTQAGDITDIEANVGTLQSQMATTTGNITTLNTTVAGLQTEVSGKASQTAVNTLATKVGTDALITTADNLSGAVNEVATSVDNLEEYVKERTPDLTVTGNGVKTLSQVLTELMNSIDMTKMSDHTILTMHRGGIVYRTTPNNDANEMSWIMGFSAPTGIGVLCGGARKAGGSTAVIANISLSGTVTVTDESATVVPSTDTFNIYY
jgi:hypothetical protein